MNKKSVIEVFNKWKKDLAGLSNMGDQMIIDSISTVVTPADVAKKTAAVRNKWGNFSVGVDLASQMVDEPIIRTLEPCTDGSVQVGEGNGPEIVVGTKKVVVDETFDPNKPINVSIKFSPLKSMEHIELDFKIEGTP